MKRILLFTLILTAALTLPAQVNMDSIKQVFHEKIAKKMKKGKVIGASVAVVSSEGILWMDHFGYADEEAEKPVTKETLFGLGSVTKIFTGTSVMQLADQGKVDIDAPFKDYLASFNMRGDATGVTAKNIMTHHSGLPSDIFKGMFSNNPENYKVVVDYINKEYLAGKPNQIRAYSNPGYTLLGHMIAEVSGMEYDQYVTKNILEPIGMHSSAFNALDKASLTYDNKGEFQKDVLLRDLPAGGLFSSTNDMSKFLMAYMNRSEILLKETTYEQILQSQHPNNPLDFSKEFALGWSMSQKPYAGDIFSHTGTTLYFNAAMAFSPKADIGVIVLTNSDKGGRIYREANNIIESIAKAKGLEKEEQKDLSDLGNKQRIEVDPSELAKYVGDYVAPGAYINVYQKKKKLFMKLQGLKVELIPVAENSFLPKIVLLKILPIKLSDNRMHFENVGGYDLMTNSEEGSEKEMMAMKLPSQNISSDWKSRTGEYDIKQLLDGEMKFFQNYQLIERDGLLLLAFEQATNGQKIEMALEIISDSRAKVAGLGRYAGQSVTYENGVLRAFGIELEKK
ncbi:MAG: serine hydrolase domain-containing protein [Ekhidna sp.]